MPVKEKPDKTSGPSGGKPPQKGLGFRVPSWLPLVIILLAGLAFRLSTTLWEPQLYPDSTQYMHLAGEIRSGAFFSDNFDLDEGFIKSRHLPPFYPFLISPFAGTQADLEKVGISISLFLSIMTMVLVYYGLSAAFSKRAAIVGTSILAFHTFTLRYASPILTEATFTFFYAAVICISIYALRKPRVWKFALCGVLCSLAYMTRDVGITTVMIVLASGFFKFVFMDRLVWKSTVPLLLAIVLAFLAATTPYLIHIRVRTGGWGLTAQMSNTSLTRQVQSFGGDRFDRDRLKPHEKGDGIVGEEPAKGIADLLKLAPGLVKKTVLNMGSYGRNMVAKLTPLVFILMVTGLGGAFFQYRREKKADRFFYAIYTAIWVLQLWVLYSLITPYMVDERYMYPLVVPGIMMAALGIEHAADRLRESFEVSTPDERMSVYVLVISMLVLGIIFLAFLHLFVDIWTVKNFMQAHRQSYGLVIFFYLAGPAVMFMLVAGYGVRTLYSSIMRPGTAAGIGAALLPAGAILASVFDRSHVIYEFFEEQKLNPLTADELFRQLFLPYLPAVLCIGGGLGLLLYSLVKKIRILSGWFMVWFPAFLVVAVFFCQHPNLYSLMDEMSEKGMLTMFAAGHKEAAKDIKDRIPSGKVIASRKPYIAYYLDGKWYRDSEGQPIPKKPPQLQKLINEGKIDYIVADSHTFRALRPALVEISLGLSSLKNARIIYSRFFPDYRRIITIYECGRAPYETPYRGSAQEHLEEASKQLKKGNYIFALRELKRAVEYDNDNQAAWKTMIQILDFYYKLVQRRRVPMLALAPHIVQELLRAYDRYTSINPADNEAQENYRRLKKTFEQEKARIEELRTRNGQ